MAQRLTADSVRGVLADEVKHRTKLWSERFGYNVETPEGAKSEAQLKFEKALSEKALVPHAASFAALAAIMTDGKVKVIVKPNDVSFFSLCAVVPLGCTNSHNYPLGKVAVQYTSGGQEVFFKQDGSYGNKMTAMRNDLRPATEAEIDEFFKTGPAALIILAANEALHHKVD